MDVTSLITAIATVLGILAPIIAKYSRKWAKKIATMSQLLLDAIELEELQMRTLYQFKQTINDLKRMVENPNDPSLKEVVENDLLELEALVNKKTLKIEKIKKEIETIIKA